MDLNERSVNTNPQWPGVYLKEGVQSSEVARMQTYMNAVSATFNPNLPIIKVDGIFGPVMKQDVVTYQVGTNLFADGIIGQKTWDNIVDRYNAIYRGSEKTWPGISLREGSQGSDVAFMQTELNEIDAWYGNLGTAKIDGVYGETTRLTVRLFQRQFGLTADGILGHSTWDRILKVIDSIDAKNPIDVTTPYSGVVMQTGSSGDSVLIAQRYLKVCGMPMFKTDGKYGAETEGAVRSFQQYVGIRKDGKIGSQTWRALVAKYNLAK